MCTCSLAWLFRWMTTSNAWRTASSRANIGVRLTAAQNRAHEVLSHRDAFDDRPDSAVHPVEPL